MAASRLGSLSSSKKAAVDHAKQPNHKKKTMNATRNSNDATGNANKQDTLMDAASLPIEVLRLGGDTLSTTQKELLETDPSVFQCLLNYRIEERVPGKRRSSAVETFCLRELLQGFAKLPLREGPPVPVSHVSLGVRIANLIVKFLEDENYLSLLLLRLQAAATACSYRTFFLYPPIGVHTAWNSGSIFLQRSLLAAREHFAQNFLSYILP